MKIIACALNAKFIHSSLAIYGLAAHLGSLREHVDVREYTINHTVDFILTELFQAHPDVVCFSCYIWNIDMVLQIAKILRTVLPAVRIVFGGPEASYDYEGLLAFGDYVVVGEGEITFRELVSFLVYPSGSMEAIKGVAFRKNGQCHYTGHRPAPSLDALPFVYKDGFDAFNNRILYYETSRGCPFRCQYCLSSASSGVRFLSHERIERELLLFLNANVRQVKLVDRTFNCHKAHAMHIWQYLIQHDNGITNFHFEIAGDLLDEEMLTLLQTARPGLFQFEIGVQSTNPDTLAAIQRKTNLTSVFHWVHALRQNGNIHIHLDLIAGLPGEDYASFARSFNEVYRAAPHQLQLGFLKLLKGSGLRDDADCYGIIYRDYAPYEVLYTDALPFGDVIKLKQMEETVERYYNSHQFLATLSYAVALAQSPFAFYEALAAYWHSNGYHQAPSSKGKLYEILYDFCLFKGLGQPLLLMDLLRFDMFLCDPVKNIPEWLRKSVMDISICTRDFFGNQEMLSMFLPGYEGFSAKQISRMCALQRFHYDVGQWLIYGHKEEAPLPQPVYILFDYKEKLNGPALATFHARYIDVTKECDSYEN